MLLGLDLGQVNDFTALVAVETTGERPNQQYAVRHIERWLGVSYPEQVQRVRTLQADPLLRAAPLVVDQTGVGRAVLDSLRAARLRPIGVTIHGGDTVTHEGSEWRVPKRDLVAVVAVLLQARRLKIADALPDAPTLVHELANFRLTIDPRTAHDSYAAWREQDHDDLVLAVALACWWGETHQPARLVTW
jgi:hypothetical protein